jgi:hypothetical protein
VQHVRGRGQEVCHVVKRRRDERVVFRDSEQSLHVGVRQPQAKGAVALHLGEAEVAPDGQVPRLVDELPGRAEETLRRRQKRLGVSVGDATHQIILAQQPHLGARSSPIGSPAVGRLRV